MKRLNTITIAGFAVCGVLLGMKALDLVEAGITLLLMVWGGYAYGAAAARAPLILWAVLVTAAGLALSLYELHRIMADDMREILEYAEDINHGKH